jgi:hypothetical protein
MYQYPVDGDRHYLKYRKDVIDNPEMQKKYKADTGKELRVPRTWKEYGEMAKYFNDWRQYLAPVPKKYMNSTASIVPLGTHEKGKRSDCSRRDTSPTSKGSKSISKKYKNESGRN